MKVFVVIFALVAFVFAEEWKVKNIKQLKEIRVECLKEHALSPEQMTKMNNFEFPDEEPVRKYLLCSSEKMGVYSLDQGYLADRIAKQCKMDVDEEEVKKAAEECIAKFPKGAKPNDVAAFEGHNCLMKSVIGERIKYFIKKLNEDDQKQ